MLRLLLTPALQAESGEEAQLDRGGAAARAGVPEQQADVDGVSKQVLPASVHQPAQKSVPSPGEAQKRARDDKLTESNTMQKGGRYNRELHVGRRALLYDLIP